MKRYKIVFSGNVQGVGFRFRSQMIAANLGLTGWVKNNYDYTVEMEVQGLDSKIDMMIEKLKSERFIRIDRVSKLEIIPLLDETEFRIAY